MKLEILEIQSQDHTQVHASKDVYCCITQFVNGKDPVTVKFAINQINDLCKMLSLVTIKAVANKKGIIQWEGEK